MPRKKENTKRIFCLLAAFKIACFSYAQQLVLPGDYPDPTVIKIGNTYWASATTSNWAPAYPILQSSDLVHWKTISHVFPQLPDWADYYFWAPELSYEKGKVYVYYAAHKKGGNLCIGVASADRPEGPYTDHGPLVCQPDGSIDPFPMRDEKGRLFLIWKEDANSIGKPTPIWAQEMNEERTALIGEKKELFRNTDAWEKNLVEGVSITRHGDYYYAFYAAAGCCGTGCTYGVGVARSTSMLGPWEKDPGNPVLTGDEVWNCPGHGTPVEMQGRQFLLYHAYDRKTSVYTGREGLLTEYQFTPDGWIRFIKSKTPGILPPRELKDGFGTKQLSLRWQWSVFHRPAYELKGGRLYLVASGPDGNYLAQKTLTSNYTASAVISVKRSSASAGIALIGDDDNWIAAIHEQKGLRLVQLRQGKEAVLSSTTLPSRKRLYLRMKVKDGYRISFEYKNGGKKWIVLNDTTVDGSYLPPWDRAVRVGLIARGIPGSLAVFDHFLLQNK